MALFMSLFAFNLGAFQGTAAAAQAATQVGTPVLGQATRTIASSDGKHLLWQSTRVTPTTNLQQVLAKNDSNDADFRGGATDAAQQNAASESGAPQTTSTPVTGGTGVSGKSHDIGTNFDGTNAVDSGNVNGFDLEPPDQGLCVSSVNVVDIVNLAVIAYTHKGKVLAGPVNLNDFFQEDPTAFLSDPRCYFDQATHSWFFTILSIDASNTHSHQDVLVVNGADIVNSASFAVFRIDTTDDGTNGTPSNAGCPCFGDQPLLGVDQFGVYMSTNEFSILGPEFNGAQIYAISKAQLVALNPTVNFVHYGNLTHPDGHGGTEKAASVQPAITRGKADAEFFMDSLDPNGTTDNRIGVWALTNQFLLNKGGTPSLFVTVITSETYGQPPLATQKPGSVPLADSFGSPEGPLNTDDDRMQQVTFDNGTLWSSLDTVIHVKGNPTNVNVSGAAWFHVQPHVSVFGLTAKILNQGYEAVQSNFLLYPAVAVDAYGQATMVATLSGPNFFPTAIFTRLKGNSGIQVAASGAGPEDGFTCLTIVSSICRWGDYSAGVTDPSNGSIWFATEYINQTCTDAQYATDSTCGGTRDPFANWSTRVFQVNP